MATGDTAPPLLSIPPPQIEPLSDDDGSSPLSDVEDKDEDPDGLHDEEHLTQIDDLSFPDNLSDANDTEAETERLYDTPQQITRHRDVVLDKSADVMVYERTPSKLRQEAKASGRSNDHQDTPLSDDDISMASSPPAQPIESPIKLQSPTLDILAEAAATQDAETRKRKRSSMPTEAIEADHPPRKRADSVPTPSQPTIDGDVTMVDEDDPSLNTHSEEHSADEAVNTAAGDDEPPDEPVQEPLSDHHRNVRKQTRSSSRKLKGADETAEVNMPTGESLDGTAPEEDEVHTGEDEHMEVDVDEEAEAAQKNEEERMARTLATSLDRDTDSAAIVERKKAAFEQLGLIEGRFAAFREKLHEERLEQINKEEAMLRSDNPTHPDYLAMMRCVDARRDERLRIAGRELELKIEASERWAVARRAQIHSQFFQAVRESRERILAELGQHWYDIQHERRKNANNVPEYGIRFPKSQAERIRNALSYNREVSILSGIAKHEGMPAAPDMRGASPQELEDDFDAINSNRHHAPRRTLHRPIYADYGGVPLGEVLGPAGAEFLEQTPWANPNHPSNAHLLQRQHSNHHDAQLSAVSGVSATTESRRPSHQPNPFAISSDSQPFNGHAKPAKNIPRQLTTSPEVTRAASLLEQTRTLGRAVVAPSTSDNSHPRSYPGATAVSS
ncbi:Sds3-like-domain-containing protein [Xylaria castorea]|nr:Sds3-like-domain-containing protein [Xylaria castorea]